MRIFVPADIFHYRDNIGEVDIIVDGGIRWGALEVKIGAKYIDQAANNLLKFVSRIDLDTRGKPAFLGVVVPSRYCYTRPDGVQGNT